MSNSTNIPTPRTDAQAYWTTFHGGFHGLELCSPENGSWSPINFSRQLERENVVLKGAITFPELASGNLEAIVYHLRQGEDNGGITREALANFLEAVKVKLVKYTEALTPPTTI